MFSMNFCDCGSLLKETENGLFCKKCNLYRSSNKKLVFENKTSSVENKETVIDAQIKYPISKNSIECHNCNNTDAYYYEENGTRALDEPPIIIYMCTICYKICKKE